MNTDFIRPAIAIVLTACGIETGFWVVLSRATVIAIVLTACGIETEEVYRAIATRLFYIAIVLTACGIET